MTAMTYLDFDPCARIWKAALWGTPEQQRVNRPNLACIYLAGMGGYGLSVISRVICSVGTLFECLGDTIVRGEFSEEHGWKVLKNIGYLLVVPIGVICPPAGYYLDEQIHGPGGGDWKEVTFTSTRVEPPPRRRGRNYATFIHVATGTGFHARVDRTTNNIQRHKKRFSEALEAIKRVLETQKREDDLTDVETCLGSSFLWLTRVAFLKLAQQKQLTSFIDTLDPTDEYKEEAELIQGMFESTREGLDLDALISETMSEESQEGIAAECRNFAGKIFSERRALLMPFLQAAYS